MKLCAHRHELPTDADVFFWSGKGSVFNNLGRFAGLGDEMSTIVHRQPARLSGLADRVGARGDGASTDPDRERRRRGQHHLAHLLGDREICPAAAPGMHAARQQRGEIGFAAINRIHQPVALAAMLLLLATALLGRRREPFADLGLLAATITAALLANAFVCGVLSNPHDRYGARLVWLAPLVVTLLLCRLYARRGLPQSGEAGSPARWRRSPIPPA